METLRVIYHGFSWADSVNAFEKAYYSKDFAKAEKVYKSLAVHGREILDFMERNRGKKDFEVKDDGFSAHIKFVIDVAEMKLKYGMGKIADEEYKRYAKRRDDQFLREVDEIREMERNQNV
jgi:hypothetical protein